jgi:hypothetical protein
MLASPRNVFCEKPAGWFRLYFAYFSFEKGSNKTFVEDRFGGSSWHSQSVSTQVSFTNTKPLTAQDVLTLNQRLTACR